MVAPKPNTLEYAPNIKRQPKGVWRWFLCKVVDAHEQVLELDGAGYCADCGRFLGWLPNAWTYDPKTESFVRS